MARTNNLTNFLTDVASAIKTKKRSSTPIPASNFDTEISEIKGIGDGYSDDAISSSFVPYNGNITSLIDSNLRRMLVFSLIKEIPKMTLDLTDYTSLGQSFTCCYGLEKIDVSQWNVSTIKYFRGTFQECRSLKEIDLSTWNVPTGTSPSSSTDNVVGIIKGCTSLKRADLRCFKGAWQVGELANGCTALEHLDIRGLDLTTCINVKQSGNTFLGSNSLGYVPTTCEIIVGTQTDKDYMTTNFSEWTNVKTVAEYENE